MPPAGRVLSRWLTAGFALLLVVGGVVGCAGASRHASRLLSPGCSTHVAAAKRLTEPSPLFIPVAGHPMSALATADGNWAFVSLHAQSGGALEVLRLIGDSARVVRTVQLPQLVEAWGMAMTRDGRWLLVAGGDATAVVSVSALERGSRSPVVGTLGDSSSGQIEVALSPDDRYAFVSDETSGAVSVFDLARALRGGFSAGVLSPPGVAVGIVRLAPTAVGVAVSPDGRLLYVTTEGPYGRDGRLWVIDAVRVERGDITHAVLASTPAGCAPVRVALAPEGTEVWVTAQQSNALLAFNAKSLLVHPATALQVVIPVGSEPVGLALVDHGRRALVANSNRGIVPGTGSIRAQTITVVNTQAALAHRPAVIGNVRAGLFPRDLNAEPSTGQILVANFNSNTVEVLTQPPPP
jgi:DNA-binding beta-propeller fold protein YncE